MKIIWQVEPSDVEKVQAFVEAQRENAFVQDRIKGNVEQRPASISREQFWRLSVGCLLTSQQRSGPDSPISRFMRSDPFPLPYAFFSSHSDPASAASDVLKQASGIRFTNRIGDFLAENHEKLQQGLWPEMQEALNGLIGEHTLADERRVAGFVRERLKGFGPKQSRNLLQDLGLTQYEIPIDSRIIKWLNDFGFPIRLSSSALSDPNYYHFVSDGVQALCQQSGILPCVFDAAVFSSFD